ncbi:Hypothetical predicted protein [Cloeon dipterum]|uniref:Serrate RNA effector molecule homolog n=3 Tax=Cloeon dipterum TaxID=197152 RepID=A0A8S1D364_9INSE|nr:Hypothetical predicted protein [Cloeon dipterum]
MGDSDDEYDRKRRDKFRGERTERSSGDFREGGRGGGERRGPSNRDDWGDNDNWQGGRSRGPPSYNEYRPSGGRGGSGGGGGRGERFSPPSRYDMNQPPMKRSRTDWGEERRYVPDSGYGGYQNNPWGPSNQDSHFPHHGGSQRDTDGLTQPPMMSFKAFLQTQDDNISDEEAIQKFNEYKLEFKRQQLNDFFVNHKDEEWFKIKYHPEESVKRKDELQSALNNRVKVFLDCLDKDWFAKVSVDSEQSEQLVKLLDSIVIKLEGGTDLDLKVLDEVEVAREQDRRKTETNKAESQRRKSDDKEKSKDKETPEVTEEAKEDKKDDAKEKEGEEEEEEEKKEPEEDEEKKEVAAEEKPSRKRKREYNSDSGSESENDDASSVHSGEKSKNTSMEDAEKNESPAKNGKEGKESDVEADTDKADEEKSEKQKEEPQEEVLRPRCLHKTSSIFLRNLAPTITKQEVEAMCKRYPGFLRVAIADPQHDRRWFRRGWVTFERYVNIKEICWNLNNIRLRDCELGAIVNRDLSRRVRTVNGITSHKQVVRNDIKVAAKIIQNLDKKANLWLDENEKSVSSDIPTFGLMSKNPVMKNITDYLIEEASAEEEELLGQSGDGETGSGEGDEATCTIDRDEQLLAVLDRLLFYLRVVHSVDYYNHCEYPNEDEMPNRCGIMHARGTPPSSKVTQQEIGDYCQTFESKIASFLQPVVKLTDEELTKLGSKAPETEVEKFVVSNTQELSKDKWLCPLSGKKFKGPEFVRKHIFNKHAEKIDEVKKEVEYFNNYLKDPKRPQLPEHPGNRSQKREHPGDREAFGGGPGGPMPPRRFGGGFYGGYGGGNRNFGGGGGGFREPYREAYSRPPRGHFNRGGGNRVAPLDAIGRPVIEYQDLDFHEDKEFF